MKHLLFTTLSIFALLFSVQAQNIQGNLDTSDPTQSHIILTHTGDRLVGKISKITDSEVIFSYKGNNMTFKRADLASIEVTYAENKNEAREEPKSDLDIFDKIMEEPKPLVKEEKPESAEENPEPVEEKTEEKPFKPPFQIVGPLDLDNIKQRHKVFLTNGDIFVGRIKEISEEKVILRLQTENMEFSPFKIMLVEIVGWEEPEKEEEKPSETNNYSVGDTARVYVLTTKRGDRFVGKIAGYEEGKVIFQLENGTKLPFEYGEIESLLNEEEVKRETFKYLGPSEIDMNGAQNLYLTPTGFNYKSGQGEYRNVEIFYNSIDYGVSDNFSIGIGLIPLFVANVVNLKTKVSFSIQDFVHVGVGGMVFAGFTINSFDDNWGAGTLHGSLSIGTEEKFINVGYGKWLPFDNNLVTFDSDLYMVGGSFRVGNKGRVFGDLIRVEERGQNDFNSNGYTMVMLGGSWFNQKNRVDFGLFMVPNDNGSDFSQPVVFPIAGYARRF